MTTASFEVTFLYTGEEPETLQASVLSTVHERVVVKDSRAWSHGEYDEHVTVRVTATFGNLVEVGDHVQRFKNMTGVPAHDVVLRRVRESK